MDIIDASDVPFMLVVKQCKEFLLWATNKLLALLYYRTKSKAEKNEQNQNQKLKEEIEAYFCLYANFECEKKSKCEKNLS